MTDRPQITQAAILVKQKHPLIVDTIQLPMSLGVGQVLVKLKASGICGSQLGEIDGVKGPDNYLPHLMGHEGFAEVLEIGPGVKQVKGGDSVVLHWRKGAGIESDPPKYVWRGKELNAGWVTTFNQHAVVSENRCTVISSNTNPQIGALFGCAITTGFGVIENNANLQIGESIVVFGAGGIGLNIIQAAAMRSASTIIAIDIHNNRLDLAKKLGATFILNSSECNVKEKIISILAEQPLDIFIDNTGIPSIIELGYELTKKQGRVVLVGVPKEGSSIKIHSLPLHFGKDLIGSHGGESIPHNDIPRYMRLLSKNKIKLDQLISKKFSLENINLAIKAMREGSLAGRVMIEL